MSGDPYEILGVKKDASQDEIQRAFRHLAKKLHPDLNPGNKKAEEEFKEISRAYDLLLDNSDVWEQVAEQQGSMRRVQEVKWAKEYEVNASMVCSPRTAWRDAA